MDRVSGRFGLQRRHCIVLTVISVEILFLLWFFPYLPMTDLPEHMMIAQIIVDYDDPNSYGDFYTIRFIWNPYSTYFWFTGLIGPVVGVIGATRLYLSLALMLTLFAFAVWIRTVAPGKEAQVIPASLLLFGTFFHVGMIHFLFSIPFLFLALALGWRVGEGSAVGRNTLWLGLILLAVYFSHILTFALTMLFLGSQWLVFHRRNGFGWLVVASAPALGFAVAYFLRQVSSEVVGFGVAYEPLGTRLELLLMPLGVFRDRGDLGGGWVYQWEAVTIWLGVLAAFAVGAIRERKWGFRAEPLILVGLMLAAALGLPSNISDLNLPIALRASYPAAFAALSASFSGLGSPACLPHRGGAAVYARAGCPWIPDMELSGRDGSDAGRNCRNPGGPSGPTGDHRATQPMVPHLPAPARISLVHTPEGRNKPISVRESRAFPS